MNQLGRAASGDCATGASPASTLGARTPHLRVALVATPLPVPATLASVEARVPCNLVLLGRSLPRRSRGTARVPTSVSTRDPPLRRADRHATPRVPAVARPPVSQHGARCVRRGVSRTAGGDPLRRPFRAGRQPDRHLRAWLPRGQPRAPYDRRCPERD